MAASYFVRTGADSFRATEHTGGAWTPDEQHIAPALGLLAHVLELDRDRRRDDGLLLVRASYDILGTVPIDEVTTTVQVLRPGRSIELVEACLRHAGRDVVRLRGWLMRPGETAAIAGTPLPPLAPVEDCEPWDPTTVWPGGFIASVELRRRRHAPGDAQFWVRTPLPLVQDEKATPTASALGLVDIANGMTVREKPTEVAFPNVDLTAHLFAEPRGEWLGFRTRVSFGERGIGETHSLLHDAVGPIGSIAQILTVRPARPATSRPAER